MVQVNLRGWDTHQNAFRDLKGKLLPSIDRCLSGFLDDLEQRGLLDETLVVMCGEMGRTPKISPITIGGKNASGEVFTPGRHHWGDVFPCPAGQHLRSKRCVVKYLIAGEPEVWAILLRVTWRVESVPSLAK